jgi:hypothetical protein
MAFQLVRLESIGHGNGLAIARSETRPLFELREDAMALAEFGAARTGDEYGYDADRDCWWARDRGRLIRFVVEPAAERVAA